MNFCSNCGNQLDGNETYCVKCGVRMKKDINNIDGVVEKVRKSEKQAKFSVALATLPIVLVFFCIIFGSISEESSGIGWLMVIYYWTIGIPIAIVSLVLGIISYKNQKNKLALWSIVIDILPFLIFFVLLLI